jgi:hypothetical protein
MKDIADVGVNGGDNSVTMFVRDLEFGIRHSAIGNRNVRGSLSIVIPASRRDRAHARQAGNRPSFSGGTKTQLYKVSQRFFARYCHGRIPAVLPARFTRRRGDDDVEGFAHLSQLDLLDVVGFAGKVCDDLRA